MAQETASIRSEDERPPERWLRVKEIFLQTLESPRDQQARFLEAACGTDHALREEVESLLACHYQAVESGFLDRLPDNASSPRQVLEAMAAALEATRRLTRSGDRRGDQPTRIDPALSDLPAGERFGDYLLLEEVGQGGMGVVYRARQLSLNRVVALKMIRAGRFSTAGEIERFLREAEAAAGLTHPGIVPVFAIGQEAGHHYYTMAFVEGLSLADRLQETGGPLEPRAAAELIRQVADAVQFAHEHGVVHRDLKPANILLDEAGVPLVVDFGLAKQIEIDSGLTCTGQILGTPSFMAPEQAAGDHAQVGTAVDVYSLGAVLYALLTGRAPFVAASVAETLRQVQHEEPVRPRQLNSGLPQDLETICLKCLAKEPTRRYGSARELSEELGRHLADQPIQARPDGLPAALLRWGRRNRSAAAFLGFLVVFLPIVIVSLALLNRRLAEESARANAEKRLAEESFHAARNAVDEQFTLVSEETLLDRPGMQPLRRKLLLGARKYYEGFLARRGNDPTLQCDVAQIYFRLGVITAALSGDLNQDAYAAANRYFERAREIYEQLPDQHDPQVLTGLGHVWTRIGHVAHKLQQRQREIDAFQTALAYRTRLVAQQPRLENRRLLANARMNLGQALLPEYRTGPHTAYDAALEHLQAAQAIRHTLLAESARNADVLRDLAKGYLLLADAWAGARPETVQSHLRSALQTLEVEFDDEPSHEDLYLRAIVLKRLGGLAADTAANADDLERANGWFAQALALLEPLSAENPQVSDYLSALGATHYEMGLLALDRSDEPAAVQRLNTALRLLQPLAGAGNPDDLLHWAGAHVILAEILPPGSPLAIEHLQAARAMLLRGVEAIQNDRQADRVRDEYRDAIVEIDRLLGEYVGI